MLRPQAGPVRGAQNSQKQKVFSAAGPRRNRHFDSAEKARQRGRPQRDSHLRLVHLSQSHLHRVRAPIGQFVSTNEEIRVCWIQYQAGSQVYLLAARLLERFVQAKDYSQRFEAREHFVEAGRKSGHQSDRFRLELL